MNICTVDTDSQLFPQVVELADQNRQTLGFLPERVFAAEAAKGNILAAEREGLLLGYLLYRTLKSTPRASITHLCVEKDIRGSGIAFKLIAELKERTTDLLCISLKCRSDYEASTFWPRVGFVAVGECEGRSLSGSRLVEWRFSHGHPNLVEQAWKHACEQKVTAAIDHNIVIDIAEGRTREAEALQADWLTDQIAICPTVESFNELIACEDPKLRTRMRERLKGTRTLKAVFSEADPAVRRLMNAVFGSSPGKRDRADIRQLMHSEKDGAVFFLTRDERILEKSPVIAEHLSLQIFHPGEFLEYYDEILGLARSLPGRLQGSIRLEFERFRSGLHELTDSFLLRELGESKKAFLRQLRDAQSRHNEGGGFVSVGRGNNLVALAAMSSRLPIFHIPVLRVLAGDLPRSIISRGLVRHLVQEALQSGSKFVHVRDLNLHDEVAESLYSLGFRLLSDGKSWGKLLMTGYQSTSEVEAALECLASDPNIPIRGSAFETSIMSLLRRVHRDDLAAVLDVEHLLWPLRLSVTSIPTYVVPIRPQWASQLFDHRLAESDLFGCDERLSFLNENVYYKAARPSRSYESGRILWYVSRSGKWPGAGKIRAISTLRSAEAAPASKIFRRYQQFGIYRWDHVLDIGGSAESDVMAMRFGDTYLLKNPVSFDEANKMIERSGKPRNHFQTVARVRESVLKEIMVDEAS